VSSRTSSSRTAIRPERQRRASTDPRRAEHDPACRDRRHGAFGPGHGRQPVVRDAGAAAAPGRRLHGRLGRRWDGRRPADRAGDRPDHGERGGR
jgi:hypothetical protein